MPLSAAQKRRAKVKAKAERRRVLAQKATQPRTIQAKSFKFAAPVAISAQQGEGKRRTFRMVANTGEPMRIDPFPYPVVIDLQSLDMSEQKIPALYNHQADESNIVGQVEAWSVEGGRLIASGYFTPTQGDAASKVLARADAGYQWQVSVGGDPAVLEEIRAGEVGQANGREYPGPCLIARGTALRELSFVVLGGDRRTSSVVARNKRGNPQRIKAMTFEQWAVGFMTIEEFSALDETAKGALQKAFDSMGMGEPEGEPAPAEIPAAEGDPEEDEPPVNAAQIEGGYSIDERDDGWWITYDSGETVGPYDTVDLAEEAAMWGRKSLGNYAAGKKPTISARHKGTSMKAQRQQTAAETARVNAITRLCAAAKLPTIKVNDKDTDLAAHAIAHGWSEEKTKDKIELLELRASRATPPEGSGPHFIMQREATAEVLGAAVLLRAGGRIDRQFRNVGATHALRMPDWIRAGINDPNRNRIMDAAHKFATCSMVDLARECCRLDGHSIPSDRHELFMQALARPTIRAASSGSSFSYIFSTSVNALLLAAYEEELDTTSGWVSEVDVQNYQSQERTRIDVGGGLKKRPRGKTAEHADYTDSQETYKIADYAKMFEIDDQDFIDDNLQGLRTVPEDMGKAAARLRPDLVYGIILDNPTLGATARNLFNTTDGNLASSGTALSMATLTTGVKAMELFRENSVNLNIKPTHLIVSPENKMLARELTQSVQILYGADDETVRGNMNAMAQENIMPVSEARLSNGVVDPSTGDTESGSTTAWYLAAAGAHTIEVGYLAGTGRVPKIRSYVLDRGRYGMGWDVQMSIGAKALDWKGLYKNAGQ